MSDEVSKLNRLKLSTAVSIPKDTLQLSIKEGIDLNYEGIMLAYDKKYKKIMPWFYKSKRDLEEFFKHITVINQYFFVNVLSFEDIDVDKEIFKMRWAIPFSNGEAIN